MGPRSIFAVAATVLGLAAACSDDPPSRPPVTEDGTPSGSAGSGGGAPATPGDGGSSDAGACTDLAATGAQIAQQVTNIDGPPLGAGGTVVDGTYDVTDSTFYGGALALPGPSGASYQGSIRITGPKFERHLVFRNTAGAVIENVVRGTIATGDASVITLDCPVAAQEQITYTATTTSLTIANLVTKEALGFTKKP